jgi:hypothetical protein
MISQIDIAETSIPSIPDHQACRTGDMSDHASPRGIMHIIPNELFLHIFSFLDAPRTSTADLIKEPNFKLTHTAVADLKAISLVSKQWRLAILPQLFKHARFTIPRSEGLTFSLQERVQPFLDFLTYYSLSKSIDSLTLLAEEKVISHCQTGLALSTEVATFWDALFNTVDLMDLLIIAPVEALGVLTSCCINMQDAWAFDYPYHYLRLQRPRHSKLAGPEYTVLPDQNPDGHPYYGANGLTTLENSGRSIAPGESTSPLFAIRPWTSLFLNEGSFIRAYSTYEFWLRKAPSVRQTYLI